MTICATLCAAICMCDKIAFFSFSLVFRMGEKKPHTHTGKRNWPIKKLHMFLILKMFPFNSPWGTERNSFIHTWQRELRAVSRNCPSTTLFLDVNCYSRCQPQPAHAPFYASSSISFPLTVSNKKTVAPVHKQTCTLTGAGNSAKGCNLPLPLSHSSLHLPFILTPPLCFHPRSVTFVPLLHLSLFGEIDWCEIRQLTGCSWLCLANNMWAELSCGGGQGHEAKAWCKSSDEEWGVVNITLAVFQCIFIKLQRYQLNAQRQGIMPH